MKILITGYKGFIGQNMVEALKDEHELSFYEWGDPPPEFAGLDWCIHLGAISSTNEKDVEKVMRQNHDFSCLILLACIEHNVNLQYASSASVYGMGDNFREDAPPKPASPYAWSKYLFDRSVLSQNFTDIRVQGFRYFNVYGPREQHKGRMASVAYHQFHQFKQDGHVKLFGEYGGYAAGEQERDFVFIDTEHIPLDREKLAWICQTNRAVGLPAIVRITSPDPFEPCTVLDGGAAGNAAGQPRVHIAAQHTVQRGTGQIAKQWKSSMTHTYH